jgi:hypothetical protein
MSQDSNSPTEIAEPDLFGVDAELQLALWSQYVDKVAVSVTEEFAARGVETILLKGPAIATWLYCDGTPRPYGDADVMVSPADWPAAESILSELGFRKELAPLDHPGMGSFASEAWIRGSENVDLHCTLWGLGATPEAVWAALAPLTERIELRGREVRTLGLEARALLLATHAAKHGDGWAVGDLERGVRMLPFDLWCRAAVLASELDAVPAFVAGMRLVAGGREIVQEIGFADGPLAEASLRAWRVPMALGIEELSKTPGLLAKLRFVLRELFPTPAFMRWWTPLARRGSVGLSAAYVWRLVWVFRYAVPAFRAWRRAQAAAAG